MLVGDPVLFKTGARVGVEVGFLLGKQPVYNLGVGRGPGLGQAAQPRREVLSDEALPLPSPARVLVHDAAVIDEQRRPNHRRSIQSVDATCAPHRSWSTGYAGKVGRWLVSRR